MPTLNIPKKTKKPVQRNETDMRKLRQSCYNTPEWRKLRETYLKRNPVCEECLKKGKVTPATSVHHIKSPFSKGHCNKSLFLDYENLEAICHECHNMVHSKQNNPNYKTIEEQIRDLDSLMSNIKKNDE